MRLRKYEIHIGADAVDAKWDNSDRPMRSRLLGVVASAVSGALLTYLLLLRPDRNGYSNWWRLTHDHFTSRFVSDAVIPICFAFAVWLLCAAVGIRSYFTSGQLLHCDRSELTFAQIPWISFNGRWLSRTFSVAVISQMELAVCPDDRANSFMIRFLTCGMEEKILQGISASDGYRILKGLKILGVDVHLDPGVRWLAQEAIRDQRAEL